MIFQGPATPAQFDNILVWRKRRRAKAIALPDVPEPRKSDDEVDQEPLDLYALSVGRTSKR
jgi:hypothetical protein